MATSGTVGKTSIGVIDIIEHAFRRCGKLASTISSELQLSAKENLFFLLSDLANRGLSLWCVQKYVLGVNAYQASFPLPVGVVDVNNALYRSSTALTGTAIAGAGYQGLDLGADAVVSNVALKFTGATAATLVLEYSADNATWTQAQAFPVAQAVPALAWVCQDSDNSPPARYWRVSDLSGVLPAVNTLAFSNTPVELPMAKLSGDDYQNLPNKMQSGGKSLQFWFDKQTTPRLVVWPVSQASIDQIVVYTQRHIQDVGALTNTLDVPQRWLESIILTLACRCALELPAGELPPGRYELLSMEAEKHLLQAEDGESDGSPIRISPNIAGYSR